MLPFLILGNPENRRVSLFQDALHRLGEPRARVLSYLEVLQDPARLEELWSSPCILRLDSPGECFQTERALVARGAEEDFSPTAARIEAREALALTEDRGRVRFCAQWFAGYKQLLGEIQTIPQILAMNDPGDVAAMFDKPETHTRLGKAGVCTPRALPSVRSCEALHEHMAKADMQRVFVKLASGSSASGVIAYRRSPRPMAITSLEIARTGQGTRFYNSLKIRRYTSTRDIQEVLHFVLQEGAHIEEWVPKATQMSHPMDLRVVVIGGKAQHFVVRLGRSPMTNLHLGGGRGNPRTLVRDLGPKGWKEARQLCERAASCFPKSLYTGVDLLVEPNMRAFKVLEVNAFGDLLPGILHEGKDTYTAEILAIKQRLQTS